MITAVMVQAVRDLTDAPLMECKRALQAAEGDLDVAVELIRTNRVPAFEDIRIAKLERRVAALEAALQKLID